MRAHGQAHRSLWPAADGQTLLAIDQRALPHGWLIARLDTVAQVREALAAFDNGVPFDAAMPLSTLDLSLQDGLAEISIEHRSPREVTHQQGRDSTGRQVEVQLVPDGTAALNPAFDVTPARLVSGLITERGVLPADEAALRATA